MPEMFTPLASSDLNNYHIDTYKDTNEKTVVSVLLPIFIKAENSFIALNKSIGDICFFCK